MKKIRIILPSILLIIYMILLFVPQSTILGDKALLLDIFVKMLISIIIICIYFVIRFYKKGFFNVLIDTLFVPLGFQVIILAVSEFTGNILYGCPSTIILLLLAYIIYYATYIQELNKSK